VRVLVACEFSGIVRDAFVAAGHEAVSCDLLDSETPGSHYKGDVRKIVRLSDEWDLMIAHPPCTFLALSGVRWLVKGTGARNGINRKRWAQMDAAADFFRELIEAPIPQIAIENPRMHGYANREIFGRDGRKPDQIIQPWQFGHPEWKTTCLWLTGLSPLQHTNVVDPDPTVGGGKRPGRVSSRIHRMGPSDNRQRERSRSYPGIAAAMAAQWGNQVAPWYPASKTRLQPGASQSDAAANPPASPTNK
jgi:hypothetical protein